MKMVRSDLASSGVIFTLDTESGFRDVVFLTASYGLGENVVKGAVDPDEFYVHKPTFAAGHRAVLRRRLGGKAIRMVLDDRGLGGVHARRGHPGRRARSASASTDAEVLELAATALTIERHYGRPMDIEWAKDGVDGSLYIVQARPETVVTRASATVVSPRTSCSRTATCSSRGPGRRRARRVRPGPRHPRASSSCAEFRPGEVLVSETTTPDWEPVMKTAAAVVTDRGGRTCHAAIIAREQGVPAVVGTGDGTRR